MSENAIEDDSLWPLNHGKRLGGEQWVLLNRRLAVIAESLRLVAYHAMGEGESAMMCIELGGIIKEIEGEIEDCVR